MPWSTPTLKDVRKLTRDSVSAMLTGAVMVPNSVLRVMSDAMAGLAHLTLLYIDWLAKQLLPDTAETEWLDRHGNIWLVNADGSHGRKAATFAEGTVTMTGTEGTIIPVGSVLVANETSVSYETTDEVTLADVETNVPIRALDAGKVGNLDAGSVIALQVAIPQVDADATVVTLTGGADVESDEQLRARILFRIQRPPMGGDADDYVLWTKAFPGVTRAWSYPQEMGIGTMTVRSLMDELRADNYGIPNDEDIAAVDEYLRTVRPVTVKDLFVVGPIAYPVDYTIRDLNPDSEAVRGSIATQLAEMFADRSQPGQTMYANWAITAITEAPDVVSFSLEPVMLVSGSPPIVDVVMPHVGALPVLGTIQYVTTD